MGKAMGIRTKLVTPDGGPGCYKSEGQWIPMCWTRVNDPDDCTCRRVRVGSRAALFADVSKSIARMMGELERIKKRLARLEKKSIAADAKKDKEDQ